MGEVLATLKILPSNAETDMDLLIEKIKKIPKLSRIEKEPVAFGLVALKASFIVEDSEGATDKIESTLREIEGIGEVEVIGISRLL